MSNLPESSTFDDGVYQLELTDPVIGGPSGISNTPLKNLANRTKYLKDHIDAAETAIELLAPKASPAFTGTPTAPTPLSGTKTAQLATTEFVQNESDLRAPVGTVIHVARATAPAGYLKANGAAISRSTYAALFAAIGTVFGAGDGVNTFNIPDLRGEFLRSLDDGRGVDPLRYIGTSQSDTLQGHEHQSRFIQSNGYSGVLGQLLVTRDSPALSWNPVDTMVSTLIVSNGLHGTPRTSSETRPRNVALLVCIKF